MASSSSVGAGSSLGLPFFAAVVDSRRSRTLVGQARSLPSPTPASPGPAGQTTSPARHWQVYSAWTARRCALLHCSCIKTSRPAGRTTVLRTYSYTTGRLARGHGTMPSRDASRRRRPPCVGVQSTKCEYYSYVRLVESRYSVLRTLHRTSQGRNNNTPSSKSARTSPATGGIDPCPGVQPEQTRDTGKSSSTHNPVPHAWSGVSPPPGRQTWPGLPGPAPGQSHGAAARWRRPDAQRCADSSADSPPGRLTPSTPSPRLNSKPKPRGPRFLSFETHCAAAGCPACPSRYSAVRARLPRLAGSPRVRTTGHWLEGR